MFWLGVLFDWNWINISQTFLLTQSIKLPTCVYHIEGTSFKMFFFVLRKGDFVFEGKILNCSFYKGRLKIRECQEGVQLFEQKKLKRIAILIKSSQIYDPLFTSNKWFFVCAIGNKNIDVWKKSKKAVKKRIIQKKSSKLCFLDT